MFIQRSEFISHQISYHVKGKAHLKIKIGIIYSPSSMSLQTCMLLFVSPKKKERENFWKTTLKQQIYIYTLYKMTWGCLNNHFCVNYYLKALTSLDMKLFLTHKHYDASVSLFILLMERESLSNGECPLISSRQDNQMPFMSSTL